METKLKFRYTAYLLMFAVSSCFLFTTTQYLKAQKKEPVNKPDVQINVKKETDKNGNIISYDSTYISTWSSDGNNNPSENDSILGGMEEQFQKHHFDILPFNSDSTFTFNRDFFNNDSLFLGNDFNSHFPGFFNNTLKEMEDMMRQHQAMIRRFFKNSPDLSTPDDSIVPQQKATPKNEDYKKGPEL